MRKAKIALAAIVGIVMALPHMTLRVIRSLRAIGTAVSNGPRLSTKMFPALCLSVLLKGRGLARNSRTIARVCMLWQQDAGSKSPNY